MARNCLNGLSSGTLKQILLIFSLPHPSLVDKLCIKHGFHWQYNLENQAKEHRKSIRFNGAKKSRLPKYICSVSTKFTYQISTSQQNLVGRWRKNHFFSSSKKRKPLISPLLINPGSWFLDMLYNFELSIKWLENDQFSRF